MKIDLGRALTYTFEDKQWPLKLGLLLLIGLIPGLNVIAWVGYQVSIAHNVASGMAYPLPAWDDWGDILVRGLMAIAAGFVYFLPLIMVSFIIGLLGIIGGQGAETLLLTLRCCLVPGVLIYGLAAALMLSVANVRYAQSDQYSQYYEFGRRVRDLFANAQAYGIGFVYQALLALLVAVAAPLSAITLIGPFVILTAFSVINGYILGSVAKGVRQ